MEPKEVLERDWRDDLLSIADRAGAAIMEVYAGDDFEVERKEDRSPLTAADLASEEEIQAGLAGVAPDVPVLSEESADVPYEERRDWDLLWVVDPLDGTKEFIKQNGEFTVNIGLVHDGRPVLGVVHAPAIGRTYYGRIDEGAIRRADGDVAPLATDDFSGDRTARVVASRSHKDPKTNAFLEELDDHELVLTGSSLKFCRIAEGAADLYPRFAPTMEWDTAAAEAVLVAAGGAVRRADGGPMTYNKLKLRNPHFIAAGDPSWFERVTG